MKSYWLILKNILILSLVLVLMAFLVGVVVRMIQLGYHLGVS